MCRLFEEEEEMDDNKRFWERTAAIYEKFTRGSRAAEDAYSKMEEALVRQLSKEMSVLELAAGPGMLSEKIASACRSLEVTDFSPAMLEQAKKRGLPEHVTFAVADATKLPYASRTYDAVVIANALHIMPDPVAAVSEIKRVLKEDGILIAPTFTREHMKSKMVEKVMELAGFKTFSRWTHQTYQDFLREQGLLIVYEKIILGHNFPISFVVCRK